MADPTPSFGENDAKSIHRPGQDPMTVSRWGDSSLNARQAQAEADEHGREFPEMFGRYRILKCLGRGPMGTVYLAEDSPLRCRVTLKIHRLPQTPPELFERLYREALTHPHLCPVHDVGQEQGLHFISMAYIEGQLLSGDIRRHVPRSELQIAELVRKLALAVGEIHRLGFIHRDIKPSNIMIDRRGEPILMDFGVSRPLSERLDPRLTRDDEIVGTPAYMSPEQIRGGRDLGPASDVYSLGVLLFQLLTGRLPFQGAVAYVFHQVLHVAPPTIRTLRPDCSAELAAVCERSLQKEIADRYASTDELAAALTGFLEGSMEPPRNTSETRDPNAPPPPALPPGDDAGEEPFGRREDKLFLRCRYW